MCASVAVVVACVMSWQGLVISCLACKSSMSLFLYPPLEDATWGCARITNTATSEGETPFTTVTASFPVFLHCPSIQMHFSGRYVCLTSTALSPHTLAPSLKPTHEIPRESSQEKTKTLNWLQLFSCFTKIRWWMIAWNKNDQPSIPPLRQKWSPHCIGKFQKKNWTLPKKNKSQETSVIFFVTIKGNCVIALKFRTK